VNGGTIRDIRTGRAIGRTDNLTELFLDQLIALNKADIKCYVVSGPCRMLESRRAIDSLRETGITVIMDRQMGADRMYIFEGEPHELGFAC
jgi:hypothetical protein